MIRASLAAAALAIAAATPSFAGPNDAAAPPPAAATAHRDASNRLLIVDGHSGRVVYDDGYDNEFCVIRRHVIGWTWDGRRIIRRDLVCR